MTMKIPRNHKLRFESKFTKHPSGCWVWHSSFFTNGYGCFRVGNSSKRAHRVSYELYKKIIPLGKLVLHSCDIKSCVNPDHLFLGTHQDNMNDAKVKKKRFWSGPRPEVNFPRDENHPKAKLTRKQMIKIYHLFNRGVRQVDLARDFGVGRSVISGILKGKGHKHLFYLKDQS